jgi:hypothetical protein
MYGSVTTELHHRDHLLGMLRTFARLHHIPMVTSSLAVTPQDEFAVKMCERAKEVDADLVMLPWNTALYPVVEHRGKIEADKEKDGGGGGGGGGGYNPFEHIFGGRSGGPSTANNSEKAASTTYAQFVRKVFSLSSVDVALFLENDGSGYNTDHFNNADDQTSHDVDGGLHSGNSDGSLTQPLVEGQHLFLPFFGGPDDRLALNLIVQLCSNPNGSVIATVVRFTKTEPDVEADISRDPSKSEAVQPEIVNSLTVQSVSPSITIGSSVDPLAIVY